jgi:hypothetical protein
MSLGHWFLDVVFSVVVFRCGGGAGAGLKEVSLAKIQFDSDHRLVAMQEGCIFSGVEQNTPDDRQTSFAFLHRYWNT